jgi:hypothetical protein
MAFLDFHQAPATGLAPVVFPFRFAEPAPMFDHLERQVLTLARGDGAPSLARHPRIARLLERLFDRRRPNPLADPRLEALRKLAVTARLRGARSVAAEVRRFMAAGYTRAQADAVLREAVRPSR